MKRFFLLLAVLAMTACVLTACGSSNETMTETDAAEAADSAGLEEIKAESESAIQNVSKVEVDTDKVAELINIQNVSLPAGSDAADFMKAIEHDTSKVNYVSYDLNDADFDTPGEYSVKVSINMPVEDALEYVNSSDIDSDADSVDLITTFSVVVTETEASAENENNSAETQEEPAGNEDLQVDETAVVE